jgi:hypothetical protein
MVIVLVLLASDITGAGQTARAPFDLGEFWPLNAPASKWTLVTYSDIHSANPVIRMSVENENVSSREFILWFSNKKGQVPGERDGEDYRLCNTPEGAWLYLDAYIKSAPSKPRLRHDVVSDRILYSPSDGPPADLIHDGSYRAAGGIGQPYLLWSDAPPRYRIQVWGHLTENSRFRWYWDATVTKSKEVIDDALDPGKKVQAVKVQEAWWDSFKSRSGAWNLGSGATNPQDGTPTGRGVIYGRTVWHGAGHVPYLMIRASKAPPGSVWCVNHIGPEPEKTGATNHPIPSH